MTLASKFYCDEYFKNEYYAKVGGISQKELNSLEKYMFELLGYHLLVSEEL